MIPDSTDESDTERDGILSTLTEWHALIIGAAVGVAYLVTGSVELLALFTFGALGYKLGSDKGWLREIQREPHYALGACYLVVGSSYVVRIIGIV